MADNYTFLDGGGNSQTAAADEIAAVKYPRVKVTWGADGASNDTSAANPLPVVQTGTPSLPTGAATEASLSSVDTSANEISANTAFLVPAVSFTTASVDISTTAQIAALNASRLEITIVNNGSDNIYIGASGVATTDGFPLMPGQAITLKTTAAVHGVAASGTINVRVIQTTVV